MFLADFDFEVRHVVGKSNVAADALSCKEQLQANSLLILETTWPKVLSEAYADDQIAQVWLKNGGTQGKLRHITWILNEESGVYMWRYKQQRVYIPEKLRLEVLQECHD